MIMMPYADADHRCRSGDSTVLEHGVRRLGAGGVVITGMQMRVREPDCPVAAGRRDRIVEVTVTGTAIARFSRVGQRPAGPALAVMSLSPQCRRAPGVPHRPGMMIPSGSTTSRKVSLRLMVAPTAGLSSLQLTGQADFWHPTA